MAQQEMKRVTVTPAIARDWLKHNSGNRTIRRRHVESLAREMAGGRWKYNYEPVLFGKSGRLLNGQHRLEAVVLSGQSIDLPVVRGVDDEIYVTLDQGARRSASDDLHARGYFNTHRLAATARIILIWNKTLPTKSAGITKSEVVEFVDANPDLTDFVTLVNGRKNHKMNELIPTSPLAAVGWMACHTPGNKAKFNEFIEKLNSGAGLPSGSPILTLRNYAINVRTGHHLSGMAWFGLVATAWNDFVKGRTRLQFRPDNFNWPATVEGYKVRREPSKVKSEFVYIGPGDAKKPAEQESKAAVPPAVAPIEKKAPASEHEVVA